MVYMYSIYFIFFAEWKQERCRKVGQKRDKDHRQNRLVGTIGQVLLRRAKSSVADTTSSTHHCHDHDIVSSSGTHLRQKFPSQLRHKAKGRSPRSGSASFDRQVVVQDWSGHRLLLRSKVLRRPVSARQKSWSGWTDGQVDGHVE